MGIRFKKIGEVIKEKRFLIKYKKQIVVDLPVSLLTDDCPMYKRPVKKPRVKKIKKIDFKKIKTNEVELKKFGEKGYFRSKYMFEKLIFEQYDHMVGTDTIVKNLDRIHRLLELKGTKKALSLTTNCNSNYCYNNPSRGATIAVTESTRNIIASGGKPLAITNCLNFGNPENKKIMWQFAKSIEGMSKASLMFNTPVVSGNVSLYNENSKDSIKPTPVISMVGLIDNIKYCRDQFLKMRVMM